MRPCSSLYRILFGLLLTLLSGPAQAQDQALCWKGNYTRDIGGVGTSCPSGTTFRAGLCYPSCPSGYPDEVGGVCWQVCPSGWENIGVSCKKPNGFESASYGWKIGDTPFNYDGAKGRCEARFGSGNCEQKGLIWYQKCGAGYERSGVNYCVPVCPSNMRNDGLYCGKDSRVLGVSKIPTCGPGMEADAGLCYPSCGNGFSGVGPVCWGSCPAEFPAQCGAACAKSSAACGVAIGDMVLNTTAVAMNALSFAFGGPGVTSAIKNAAKAGTTAAGDSILRTTAQTTTGMILSAAKGYAKGYAKEFVKTSVKNQFNKTNLYWTAAKGLRAGALTGMNQAATEFGVLKEANNFDLNNLTALDPTGISAMVMSFAKYPTCSGESFLVDSNELDYGYIGTGTKERTVRLTAQRAMTITRIASPAMTNCSITPVTDCVGRQLLPGESCTVRATVDSKGGSMDAELRIYTDTYTSVPYPIHVIANSAMWMPCTATPNVDEAINLTAIAGAWAYNGVQSQKVVVQANGSVNTWSGSGQATLLNAAARSFRFNTGGTVTTAYLDEVGDKLTFINSGPTAGTITAVHSNKVLDIPGGSTQPGVQPIQYGANGQPNQVFTFEPLGDGTYKIVNRASGLVLDVEGGSLDTGARIVQYTWNGGANQRFYLQPVGTHFRIVNVNSGKVLNVSGDDNQDGSGLIQWDITGANNELFKLAGTTVVTSLRRPWNSRCDPGKTWFAGLCYDVPPGQAMTTPGIMGKPCPGDWRDDGTSCYPPWTGLKVIEADPNGSFTQRHPLLVTDCTKYSQANNQSCPANFRHSAVCTCQAVPTSKNIQIISGSSPIR